MKKVITYGTFDLFHRGHENLLKRAKALGDYLIVGVTSEDFDKARGKINVQDSLSVRMENVRKTGFADEIIVESYEGQKIDDICKYHVDIFTLGSDWAGKFDYLNEYCRVIYLDRTEGISSSELRTRERSFTLGLVGSSTNVSKISKEASFVDGLQVREPLSANSFEDYRAYLEKVDGIYLYGEPEKHEAYIEEAIRQGKHILAESPVTTGTSAYLRLKKMSEESSVVLMEALKTAYSTAFSRLVSMVKGGKIGKVVSVDATCTSKVFFEEHPESLNAWGSLKDWGPIGLLPVFSLLGTDYREKHIYTKLKEDSGYDLFTKIDFYYEDAVASVKVGKGVKSEGDLVITGEKGYVYVPAPWWKTDFFEVRFENQEENQRYFYELLGEGIRYELVAFLQAVHKQAFVPVVSEKVTEAIAGIMEDFDAGRDVIVLGDR